MNRDIAMLIMSFYVNRVKDVTTMRLVNKLFNRTVADVNTWRHLRPIEVETNIETILANKDNLYWYHGLLYIKPETMHTINTIVQLLNKTSRPRHPDTAIFTIYLTNLSNKTRIYLLNQSICKLDR